MFALIFAHAHTPACKTNHFYTFFFCFDCRYFSPPSSLSSPQFISHQSVLTYSQPTGEVSHDTQDADTKISHLIYFGSVYVCQSLFVSLPSTHLYTLQNPCCAHRWYWHMAATFAVFANLALLLQCLFLLPSGLHSALCKCHSSPVVSLGRCEFRVRSVMLSVKYHSNSTQQ